LAVAFLGLPKIKLYLINIHDGF